MYRSKLKTQLTLLFSLILFLALGLSTLLVIFNSVNNKLRDADNRIIDLVNLLHTIKKTAPEKDYHKLLSTLSMMKFSSNRYSLDITRIKLKEKGKLLIFSKRSAPGKEKVYKTIVKDRKGKEVYRLDIYYAVSGIYKDIYITILTFIGIGVLVFLLGFFLILSVSSKITSPVKKLKRGMEEIGKGNFKIHVDIKTNNEIGYLAETFNLMAKKLDEAEFVKTVFKRYVTSQVAEQLIKNKNSLKLNGEKRNVSILFTDIRGFTKLSNSLPPEEIISILNSYFVPIIDVIFKYEGVLDKFLGDGLLAFWNAPLEQANFSFKAIEAALEIKSKIKSLNEERKKKNQQTVDMGIGVNTGEVIAGNIGSSKRMEYTVVGAPVNIASRIQNLANNCRIYTTEKMAEIIKTKYFVEKAMEKVAIKGIDELINIYEIKGRKQ